MKPTANQTATRFAIIGCGLIGRKRLNSLRVSQLRVACDLDLSRAEALVDDLDDPGEVFGFRFVLRAASVKDGAHFAVAVFKRDGPLKGLLKAQVG